LIRGYWNCSKSGIVHDWRDHVHNPDLVVPMCGGTYARRDQLITDVSDDDPNCKQCAKRRAVSAGEKHGD
jgi:hypothetical protein